MQRCLGTVLGSVVLASTLCLAGDPDYTFVASEVSGDTSEQVEISIDFINDGEDVFAWSVAVCHDPDVVALDNVTGGDLLLTVNEGGPPTFEDVTRYEDGFVAGVIICLTSCDQLEPASTYTLYEATYTLEGLAPSCSAIEFCDTLPAIENEVVIEGGEAVTPGFDDGLIEILGPEPIYFTLSTADTTAYYDPSDGIAVFDQSILLEEHPENIDYVNDVTGLRISLGHDGILLEATSVSEGSALSDTNAGLGADFFATQIFEDGVYVDVVVSEELTDALTVEDPGEVVVVTYEGASSLLEVNPFGFDTDLTFDAVLLSPADSAVDVTGFFVGVLQEDATVSLLPREQFIRGDVNDDGIVTAPDAIALLDDLFGDGPDILCGATRDVNGSFGVDLADPIAILAYLFLDGQDPAAPFPDCGFDPAEVSSCPSFDSCP